eukprot:TCONS_00049043-protein
MCFRMFWSKFECFVLKRPCISRIPPREDRVTTFGGDRTSSAADKPLFQKEAQTETSLFGEPFKPYVQQYSLFGENGAEGASAAENQPQDDFPFNPVIVDPTSPGVVGDRAQQKERADDEILTMFPYRLRVSEYNPLSYQVCSPLHSGCL